MAWYWQAKIMTWVNKDPEPSRYMASLDNHNVISKILWSKPQLMLSYAYSNGEGVLSSRLIQAVLVVITISQRRIRHAIILRSMLTQIHDAIWCH